MLVHIRSDLIARIVYHFADFLQPLLRGIQQSKVWRIYRLFLAFFDVFSDIKRVQYRTTKRILYMDLITIFLPLFLINCFKNFREILIVRSWRCMDGLGYLLLGTISPTHLWGEGGNQSATIRIFEG